MSSESKDVRRVSDAPQPEPVEEPSGANSAKTAEIRASRVPQLRDDVFLRLVLPPETEEWADELLAECDAADEIERTDEGLILTRQVGGNCNAISNARMWFAEVEDALDRCDVDPMSLTLTAWTEGSDDE